jgi:hypothetical protein
MVKPHNEPNPGKSSFNLTPGLPAPCFC